VPRDRGRGRRGPLIGGGNRVWVDEGSGRVEWGPVGCAGLWEGIMEGRDVPNLPDLLAEGQPGQGGEGSETFRVGHEEHTHGKGRGWGSVQAPCIRAGDDPGSEKAHIINCRLGEKLLVGLEFTIREGK